MNTKHSIPTGDWFDVVSSPHLLAEILMYICLTVLLWPNSCWLLILYWVLANQVDQQVIKHRTVLKFFSYLDRDGASESLVVP